MENKHGARSERPVFFNEESLISGILSYDRREDVQRLLNNAALAGQIIEIVSLLKGVAPISNRIAFDTGICVALSLRQKGLQAESYWQITDFNEQLLAQDSELPSGHIFNKFDYDQLRSISATVHR